MQPLISIIIPVYNAEENLALCLNSVFSSDFSINEREVIVVNDASTDGTAEIAKKFGCAIINLPEQHGPSYARNIGAKKSTGEYIMFVDSDIVVKQDTISKLINSFNNAEDIGAVWGIMDKKHPNKNFLSQYKNLFLHYLAMKMPSYSGHLVSAIMIIKRATFNEVGGFDSNITVVSIEDVDLGSRISSKGNIIFQNKDVMVEHLKHFTFLKLLKNDFSKNVAFGQLILEAKAKKKSNSNRKIEGGALDYTYILSLPVAVLLFASFLFLPGSLLFVIILSLLFLAFNIKFLSFLIKENGVLFAAKSVGMIFIEKLNVSFAIAIAVKRFVLGQRI